MRRSIWNCSSLARVDESTFGEAVDSREASEIPYATGSFRQGERLGPGTDENFRVKGGRNMEW